MTIEEIKQKDVIYISASWCGPCKVTKPIVEKVNSEIDKDIEIIVMDEVSEQLATYIKTDLGVRSVPTTIFFKEGVEVFRKVGAYSESELKILILEHVG
tara:strand:- start:2240 stop:2536 length:297 start_codon:yes stop_codon:yes gene_type:complete